MVKPYIIITIYVKYYGIYGTPRYFDEYNGTIVVHTQNAQGTSCGTQLINKI